MKKKSGGGIDLIGTGMQIGVGIVELAKQLAPTPEQKAVNERQRRIKRAIRILKQKKNRNQEVELYVKVNFSDFEGEDFSNTLAFIQGEVGRK